MSVHLPSDPFGAGLLRAPPTEQRLRALWRQEATNPAPVDQRLSAPLLHEVNKPENAWFYTTSVAQIHYESIRNVTSDDVINGLCTPAAALLVAMQEIPDLTKSTKMSKVIEYQCELDAGGSLDEPGPRQLTVVMG